LAPIKSEQIGDLVERLASRRFNEFLFLYLGEGLLKLLILVRERAQKGCQTSPSESYGVLRNSSSRSRGASSLDIGYSHLVSTSHRDCFPVGIVAVVSTLPAGVAVAGGHGVVAVLVALSRDIAITRGENGFFPR
jgi:hypothetical protein